MQAFWTGFMTDLVDDVYLKFIAVRRLHMHDKSSVGIQAPLIALVGCDGSGKSTLSMDLTSTLNQIRPTERAYLGQGSGNIGRKISQFRFGGRLLARMIEKKAHTARTKGKKIPGVLTACVIFAFSCIRFYNFRKMMRLRRQNVMILTDRYPQLEVVGFYDGPGLSAAHTSNWLISRLVKWEYALYKAMAAVKPDLIIRLNVDTDTAFQRKPDHDYQLLNTKVEATQKLRFQGAPILDVDATRPYDEVYETALEKIREIL